MPDNTIYDRSRQKREEILLLMSEESDLLPPLICLALLFLIWSCEYSLKVFSTFSVNEILVNGKGCLFLRYSSSHILYFIRSLSFRDDVYAYFFLALLWWVKTFVAWVVVPTIFEASSLSSFCVEGMLGCFSRYSVLRKVPL